MLTIPSVTAVGGGYDTTGDGVGFGEAVGVGEELTVVDAVALGLPVAAVFVADAVDEEATNVDGATDGGSVAVGPAPQATSNRTHDRVATILT
jgi:hypothetical protein